MRRTRQSTSFPIACVHSAASPAIRRGCSARRSAGSHSASGACGQERRWIEDPVDRAGHHCRNGDPLQLVQNFERKERGSAERTITAKIVVTCKVTLYGFATHTRGCFELAGQSSGFSLSHSRSLTDSKLSGLAARLRVRVSIVRSGS
jgi:hypothetical protein